MTTRISHIRKYAALLALVALGCTFADCLADDAKRPQDAPFYFVQISDSHAGTLENNARLKWAVDAVNALPKPIEFVVHTGDLCMNNISKPGYPELRALGITNMAGVISNNLGKIKAPVYVTPGNHDIVSKDLSACIRAFNEQFGPLGQTKRCKGVRLILLYTESLRKGADFMVKGYDPVKYLEREFRNDPDTPTIVFHHAPPTEDFYRNEAHYPWSDAALKRWNKALAKGNVIAEICGHHHRGELHYSQNGHPIFVGEPTADFFGKQSAFRVYKYDNGRISYQTVYREEAAK